MKQNVTVRQHKDCPANNVPIHSDSQTCTRDKAYRINFFRSNKSIPIRPYIAFGHSNRALGTRMYVHVRAYITNSCFPYSVQLCTCCTPFKTVSLHHLLLISRGISGWFELSCVEYVQMWLTGFCRIPSACDCTSYMQEKNWREKITQWKWK